MTDYERAEILELECALDSEEARREYSDLYEAGRATIQVGGFDINGNWHANGE